ncbi:carboxymethylenebutenolidase [Nocardia sp. MH4]|jgi:carboxymethylenebutenolidase|uniref:dienelactone hydrolase family protein n=1 Tax=Nocardia TaxID=1817 RepID=UPI001C4E7526|nr:MULTISPECIES: dienelactone hydrolase family protein [Nocardia]MBW0273960.1 carboxymethylenebutenolidase [Nocardia sp. MH4]
MESIEIDTPTGRIDALIARPQGEGPWPGVVVLHDALGINADLRHQLDIVADAGYLAIAPNLFARGRVRCIQQAFRAVAFTGKGPAVGEILAARDRLAEDPDCTGRIAVLGFCLGGGFALLTAPQGFHASAPFYGSLYGDYRTLLDGACPVVASYGRLDPALPGAAHKLETALTAGGVDHDIKTYPNATHSFANVLPGNAVLERIGIGYDAAATDDAWQRIFAFFDRHLRTGA